MSDLSTAVSPSVIAFLLGIISCIVLHARPIRSDRALCLEFAVFVALCCTNPNHLSSSLRSSLIRALFLIAIHAFTLCSVTVLYRISPLHPLWRFPGPFVHKFTSLYSAYKTYTGERPFYIDGLHKCYGPVVRIGPNFLSINSFDALAPIYGATSTMMKSAAYTFGGARGSGLFFMKDREEHGVRRKIWAPAFSLAILRPFRDVIARRTEQFIHILETRCGSQGFVDIGNVISLFTYDVMGDITFGSSSQADMLERGDPENLIKSGQMATMAFEIIGEVPALFSIAWYLPLSRKMRALEERAGKWIAARRDAGTTAMRQKDIASFLLAHEGTPQALSDADLRVDSLFAIQAGSDTPAGILTFMYFFLISDPTVYAALRDELDGRIQTSSSRETLDIQTLVQLPYLSAFLTESLRLGTPFHGFPRVVPARGAVIAGEFVPGGTTVSVPGWSQHIDEANFFPDPHAFRPQRWLPGGLGPGSRANKAAVIAFSSGPFACLGKQLAIEELSINFARTILALDLSFAPGFDPVAFWDGVWNIRTPVFTRPLMVIVKRRRVNIA